MNSAETQSQLTAQLQLRPTGTLRSPQQLVVVTMTKEREKTMMKKRKMTTKNSSSTLLSRTTSLVLRADLLPATLTASTAARAGQGETKISGDQKTKRADAVRDLSNSSTETNVKQDPAAPIAQSAEGAGESMTPPLGRAKEPADVFHRRNNTITNGREPQEKIKRPSVSAMAATLACLASLEVKMEDLTKLDIDVRLLRSTQSRLDIKKF